MKGRGPIRVEPISRDRLEGVNPKCWDGPGAQANILRAQQIASTFGGHGYLMCVRAVSDCFFGDGEALADDICRLHDRAVLNDAFRTAKQIKRVIEFNQPVCSKTIHEKIVVILR